MFLRRANLLKISCCAWLAVLLMPISAEAQMRSGQIDIFMGVDFNYRDIYLKSRPFDFLINLTPGVKWNLGHRWEIAASALIPILNQMEDDYGKICLDNLSISKQFAFGNRFKFKASAGIFNGYRYGIDAKGFFIVNDWFAVKAEAGLIGFVRANSGWKMSKMKEVVGRGGPVFYLKRWNTQFTLTGGRYIYGDWGGEAECFRHFKHVSVGVYASYSELGKENAGFKVVVMLPPYKRTRRKVNFRPASNFRLTYREEADNYSNRYYITDPEENERQGWFDRDLLPWGQDNMAPDFNYKEKEPADSERKEDKK